MKIKFYNFIAAIVALLMLPVFGIPISAEVAFSKGNQGNSQSVFIAGNPDLYPIEYYNPKTERYEGIMPILFERISESCGIDFTYIYTTPENKQDYLAENNQVDIVSAYVSKDSSSDFFSGGQTLLTFTYQGKQQPVTIGFTNVCDPVVKEAIMAYLGGMSESELTSLTVDYVMANSKEESTKFPIALVTVIAIAILCIAVLIWLLNRSRQKNETREMYNPKSGLYSKSYFKVILSSKINDLIRTRYFVVYLTANYGQMIRYYGIDQTNRMEDYIASVLHGVVEKKEYCAHLENAAFVLLFQAAGKQQAEERIDALLKKINEENDILNEDYRISVLAGVYQLSRFRENAERILNIAKEAYLCAEESSLPYFFADASFVKFADQKALLQKETAQAIKKNQFLFYMQYVVDIKANRIVGAESLSRWEHPREGLLTPNHYINLMQQANNIYLLDYYMLEKTCRQLERWNTEETKHFSISCNFDRKTIAREDFFNSVTKIISQYHFAHNRLIFEITEDSFAYNKEMAMRNTALLRDAGYCLALDDFGVGYTSIQNVIEYHITHLKLDITFVPLMKTKHGQKLVKNLATTAHNLGLIVLMEGVETYEDMMLCRALDIDMIQGFVFSRVIPSIEADRVRRRLEQRLLNGDPPDGQTTYADVNPDAADDDIYEDDEENNPYGVRYRWSFLARLHRAPEEIAGFYSDLKNEFLKYKKVRSRISWSCDTVSYKRMTVAKFVMRQKSLLLYLALDPKEYEESKYFFVDASEKKKYEAVPFRIKIRGSRGFKHAKELIEDLARKLEWQDNAVYEATDHSLPIKTVEALIDEGLIKVNDKAAASAQRTQAAIPLSQKRQESTLTQAIPSNTLSEETDMQNNDTLTHKVAEWIYDVYYRWSFTARLHQAPKTTAAYYSELKNAFLRYQKVKSRISWSCDTISYGRVQLAKFVLTQKHLYVYLALYPKDYEGTKYFFTDQSDVKKYEKVPLRVRVRSERGVKYAIELIEMLAQKYNLQLINDYPTSDYTLPNESFDSLLERRLIKQIDLSEKQEQPDEDAIAASVIADEIAEAEPEVNDAEPETPVEEAPVIEEVAEPVVVEEPPVDAEEEEASPAESEEASCSLPVTIEETPAEQIQNADLIEAETIHVAFLQKLCQQFDADELTAHVKVVYKNKKKKENKTSIFDVLMKKNQK